MFMKFNIGEFYLNLKSGIICEVTPCGLVGVYLRFGGKYCPHLQCRKVRAANIRIMLVALHLSLSKHSPLSVRGT
jgi:hypothetical protein